MNQEIHDNYVSGTHPSSFSSPGNLQRVYGRRFATTPIINTLQHIDAYTLHREFKKPRVTNPFYVFKKRQQVQMDLLDVSRLRNYNNGITFWLVAIDSFTKFAWVRPLKSKAATKSLEAIKSVVDAMGEKPESIFFDRGTEFKNQLVQQYLNTEGIAMVHPNSDKKAVIIERFNRSIQAILYRFITENQSETYEPRLQSLVEVYNTRKHRTLNFMTPTDAEKAENQARVLSAHNAHYAAIAAKRKAPKYSVGERVRVKNIPLTRFHRGYHQSFRLEEFEIVRVNERMPIPMYILKSRNDGEEVKGGFYAEELQPIKGDVFKIQVLKRRKRKGREEIFVHYVGWDNSHDEWIPAQNVDRVYTN